MGERINKEFDRFQEELRQREKKLKYIMTFESDSKIDKELEELKEKKLSLEDESIRR